MRPPSDVCWFRFAPVTIVIISWGPHIVGLYQLFLDVTSIFSIVMLDSKATQRIAKATESPDENGINLDFFPSIPLLSSHSLGSRYILSVLSPHVEITTHKNSATSILKS